MGRADGLDMGFVLDAPRPRTAEEGTGTGAKCKEDDAAIVDVCAVSAPTREAEERVTRPSWFGTVFYFSLSVALAVWGGVGLLQDKRDAYTFVSVILSIIGIGYCAVLVARLLKDSGR